jgi:hypothetical protein
MLLDSTRYRVSARAQRDDAGLLHGIERVRTVAEEAGIWRQLGVAPPTSA